MRLNTTQLLLVPFIVRNQGLLELAEYRVTDILHPYKYSWLLLVSICVMIIINFVLAFSNFSLMIVFCKEKEVKASSFALTIVIFIGSCFLLLSATLTVLSLILTNQNITQISFICVTNSCSFTTGMTVLLLTYVLKTLRIWRIFGHFGKLSAAWSDSRLLVVVLIGSAVVLILRILTTYDIKNGSILLSFRNHTAPPYYEYTTTCINNINSFSLIRLIIFIVAGGINCLY